MSGDDFLLERHPGFAGVEGPVVVCVMDGVGIGRRDTGDAVWQARTPHLDWLAANAPTTALAAHGIAVGMPSNDDMGNSEVGHNAIGAGRIFDQGAKLVQQAIRAETLFEGETGAVWQALTERVRESGEAFHFIGLLSDGNVHSHIQHLFALLQRCDREEVRKVRVHILMDGRDVPETSGLDYIDALEAQLDTLNEKGDRDYRIASGGGRMVVTMDRYEADWAVVERGWQTHVHGQARGFASARQAIQTLRSEEPGIGDQNLPPFVIDGDDGKPLGPIGDGASVVLFNFRGDRAIEISRAFEADDFDGFDRGTRPKVGYAGMMEYDGDLQVPSQYLVAPPAIDRTLGEHLARNGIHQLAISETQKYGHVTYFWNGNRSSSFDDDLERYIEVPSDTLPFEERPWMKAAEITDRLLTELATGGYRHARVNFANGDMVGHTGRYEASIQAVEAVDLQLGRLLPAIRALNGALLVTADHGNADEMFELDQRGAPKLDAEGQPRCRTSHTLNAVPLHVFAPGHDLRLKPGRKVGLANLAATVLQLLGYAAPADYHASLLED
ncbi:MAG: 2,3-bisphosphoglycerate-independent phosphoglycerate mutase [Deltaproteobacteria bacterium]|nr:2,3-bisphosphoglycerate-independent phosphoglycerate mutase [Deltaproteobacteria bacterium]MBW2361165.1 2,3-bisphosphoglycerate-independent phosphoglycerate mutase [Deltaproteobacteria bacterium]